MAYPELPLYPSTVEELLAPVAANGRPLIWDEDGVPLNSDHIQDGVRANRCADDYTAAPDLITWPETPGQKWANSALMRRVQGSLPDMLAMTVETAQSAREILDIDDLFEYPDSFMVIEGLQKAWSLLMYGPRRLANGQLPRHFANLQRVLKGHEGAILHMAFDSPADVLAGNINEGKISSEQMSSFIFDPKNRALEDQESNEYCPAGRAAHTALMDCLLLPEAEATAKHHDQLAQADPNRRLASYDLTPAMVTMLGLETANILLDLTNRNTHKNLLMTHRYLVGDSSPEVHMHMLIQAFGSE